MLAASAQAGLAALAYLLLFLSVRRVFGRGLALGTLAVVALHPVLMFCDVSFEDSTLALALLSSTIYAALWARDGRAVRWLVPGTAAGLASEKRRRAPRSPAGHRPYSLAIRQGLSENPPP